MHEASPSILALLEGAHRDLAMFGSETMGAQSYLGQFRMGVLKRRDRRALRNLIEDSPLPYMVIDPRPGLHLIDINDSYAEATITRRSQVAGERLFDVFPDNPDTPGADGVHNLYDSLRQAAQSSRPHVMALQRYDVRDAAGGFVEKYWRPTNVPIFDEDGRLIYLLHHGNPIDPD